MANPPIVIPPFANVPAPGSPIKSDWPQQISQYVADGARGVVAYTTTGTYTSVGATLIDVAGATVTFTAVSGRWYLVVAQSGRIDVAGATGQVYFTLADGVNAVSGQPGYIVQSAGNFCTLTAFELSGAIGSGSVTRKLRASISAGSMNVQAGTLLAVIELGATTGAPGLLFDALRDADAKPVDDG